MIQKLFTFLISFRLGGCKFRKIRFWNIRLGDVTRDNIRNDDFFAQYSVVMLEQGCNHSEQCRNTVEMI